MQCCKCKKELQDGVLFCKYCGARQPTQQKDVERDETTQVADAQHLQQPNEILGYGKAMAAHTAEARKREKGKPFFENMGQETTPRMTEKAVLLAEPEEEPLYLQDQPAEELDAHRKIPLIEKEPKKVEDSPMSEVEVQPELLLPEINIPSSSEKTTDEVQPIQSESGKDLVFDLDQVLSDIASSHAENPVPALEKEESNVEIGQPILFNIEQIDPTSEADITGKYDRKMDNATGGKTEEQSIQEFPTTNWLGPTPPSSEPTLSATSIEEIEAKSEKNSADWKLEPVPERMESASPAVEQNGSPFIEPQPIQRKKSAGPIKPDTKTAPDASAAELLTSPEVREKKVIKPVVWRLAVIAVELGVIAYLSFLLFF